MTHIVTDLYRYPIKGMNAEALEAVDLLPGEAFPLDRAYAFALTGTRFDENAPTHLPKTEFLMLMRDERLAELSAVLEDNASRVTIYQGRDVLVSGDLSDSAQRAAIERSVGGFMGLPENDVPRLVHADGHTFSDHRNKVVSIINLASVRALEEAMGGPVHPLRFRGNLYIDGGGAWEEFQWIGQALEIGTTRLTVTKRTDRCAATSVNPDTARRDLNVVKGLTRAFGHFDMGIYARVEEGGTIAVGDAVGFPGN